MNLFAQAAFRPYAHAIADDQHADHQLRIDREATGAAVERFQRLTDVIKVEMSVDASQHVIGRDMVVKAEVIETGPTSLERPSSPHPPPNHQAVNHGIAAASINRRVFQRYRPKAALHDGGYVAPRRL
jgi:hypothetical protein